MFHRFASIYDIVNGGKDYDREAAFVSAALQKESIGPRTLLEIGCGTGRHSLAFATLGFDVTGVELSEDMIRIAHNRKIKADPGLRSKLNFYHGDARSLELGRKYDVCVALFNVICYQTTNEDVAALLASVRSHLNPGGLFAFDAWYGPGALTHGLVARVEEFRSADWHIIRTISPQHLPNEDIGRLHYRFFVWPEGSQPDRTKVEMFEECHPMRYFFAPELRLFAAQSGFDICGIQEWMTGEAPKLDSWRIFVVARAQ